MTTPATTPVPPPTLREPNRLQDLVALTKPRVISLLLVTAVAPMYATPSAPPALRLVLAVLVGGYLMAGGANAINMWFDRDIDDVMSRTKRRPIPAGRVSPGAALLFGIGLGAIAFALLWALANPLSAWLALAGLLFYVFIYTIWLKRSNPQNIVIGGAAGAFPPLVGWAAVEGDLSLAAVYMFAIVFFWTPPHFWALALIKRQDYARAGVPMLPVVRSEGRTKAEMLVYTWILLPLTAAPVLVGAFGWVYLASAVALWVPFLGYVRRIRAEAGATATCWKLYRYSLLYLALLFVAMGVDRAWHWPVVSGGAQELPLAPVDGDGGVPHAGH